MEPDSSSRKQTVAIGYLFAADIGMVLLQWVLATYNTVDTIPYSEFEQLVAQGNVTEVAVGQDAIQGKLKDKLASGRAAFVTARVDPALAEKLEAKGVARNAREQRFAPHLKIATADSRRWVPGWRHR